MLVCLSKILPGCTSKFGAMSFTNIDCPVPISIGPMKSLPIKISIATEEIIGKLWGSEIIAQTSDTIVIQDALDPSLMKLN